jgi:hypothetical protein
VGSIHWNDSIGAPSKARYHFTTRRDTAHFTFKLPMSAVLYANMIERCNHPIRGSGTYVRFKCSIAVANDIRDNYLEPQGIFEALPEEMI